MKAIQYHTHGGNDVLTWSDIPEPTPGPGEVRLKIHAAGLNHLDIHVRRGLPGMKVPLPHIPGCDGAGVIDAIGTDVKGYAIGDRVLINPGKSCGTCERCSAGEMSCCPSYGILGEHTNGSMAEKVVIPAMNAIPIPDSMSFEMAAAAPLVAVTAWSMVVTKANVRPGQKVLVMGAASGVSSMAIQMAKLLGATVFSTASSPERAAKAKQLLPVDEMILYKEEPVDKTVKRLTNGKGVDVVIEHVGGDQWVRCLRALKNGGTLVTCGATAGFDPKEDLRHIFFRQLRVLGSTMGNNAELNEALRLVFKGTIKPIIDSTFSMKDARSAFERLESGQAFGKVILKA